MKRVVGYTVNAKLAMLEVCDKKMTAGELAEYFRGLANMFDDLDKNNYHMPSEFVVKVKPEWGN